MVPAAHTGTPPALFVRLEETTNGSGKQPDGGIPARRCAAAETKVDALAVERDQLAVDHSAR
jgi:hypothetical protein